MHTHQGVSRRGQRILHTKYTTAIKTTGPYLVLPDIDIICTLSTVEVTLFMTSFDALHGLLAFVALMAVAFAVLVRNDNHGSSIRELQQDHKMTMSHSPPAQVKELRVLGRSQPTDISSDTSSAPSVLTIQMPLMPLEATGYVKAVQPGMRVALDVGIGLNSPSVARWIGLYPDPARLHVFGVEGNPYVAWSVRLATDPRFANDMSTTAKTWAAPMDLHRVNATLGTLRAHHMQYSMIPAAAGTSDGWVDFNLGDYYSTSVGSLFAFARGGLKTKRRTLGKEHAIGSATVPLLRLAHLLDFVHPDAHLEVLKIDAQAADYEVLVGVGTAHLKRFKCVLGEFGASGYAVPKERYHKRKEKAFLEANGFVSFHKVWFNTAFAQAFETATEPNLCFNYEMNGPLPNLDIAQALRVRQLPTKQSRALAERAH